MKLTQVELIYGWGLATLTMGTAPRQSNGARAYDHKGHRLTWLPGPAIADAQNYSCDIEERSRPVDPVLACLAPPYTDFYCFWVMAEVSAKLANIPIMEWLYLYRRKEISLTNHKARLLVLPQWRSRWALAFGAC